MSDSQDIPPGVVGPSMPDLAALGGCGLRLLVVAALVAFLGGGAVVWLVMR
jgi:hypothetical protein